MSERKEPSRFTPSGFFVLRTPVLPFGELAAWSEGLEAVAALDDPEGLKEALARDRKQLRDRLLTLLARPELRDALFVASPSLDEAFGVWQKEPESERGRKIEPALVSYFSRATARATPFGLFAGCTTGTIDSHTRLKLQARERYERHSRLDMDYLWALAEAVERDPRLRAAFVYEPNSSLYEAAGRLRLAEARLVDDRRSYHLVAIAKDPYLTATLDRSRGGAHLKDLAHALVDDEISPAEAEEYVGELVDSQLLVADVHPAVTGDEPIHGLIATLLRQPETAPIAERLDEARITLDAIDAEGLGASPDSYRAIAALLGELPAQPELSRLVQVDLVKPAKTATLGRQVVSEIARGVGILQQLAPLPSSDSMSRFREEFLERYETREVPLVEALDEETGIGFEASNSPRAEASPLLAGLPFGGDPERGGTWSARDGLLLGKLTRALAQGDSEIELEKSDLEVLSSRERTALPDAFYVMATVAAESENAVAHGAFRVVFDHGGGPSGAVMLGRFCHADGKLLEFVRAHLQEEEACHRERIFAEIVHLPEGRIGNILCRPVLRGYEVPYLGRSGAPADRQIPITDLLVSVIGERIVLRSRRLGREIMPRLTTAHNYDWRSLGVYRFLCRLQHQDVVEGLAWDWGPLAQAPYLPRVVSGRLILSRARWNLDEPELKVLGQASDEKGFASLQAWRDERRLPRYVALVDGDNELVTDLDNVLSVEALAHQIRGWRGATLVEMFPGPDQLCVSGPEGRYLHQLIVPFIQSGTEVRRSDGGSRRTIHSVRRHFPPGSEWLYAKLYGGTATAEQVLSDAVRPMVASALASGDADGWFFIRYGDPDAHLRVRLHGPPERLHASVLPRLQAAVAPLLDSGQLWRLQLDTYEREVERYGGDRGIELAEEIFKADSDAVLAILGSLSGDEGLGLRWRLALRGIDLLFDDLGLTLEEKRSIARYSRESYGREFGVDSDFRAQVGQRFRMERASLEALLDPSQDCPANLAPGLEALSHRSLQIAPLTTELQELAKEGRLSLPMTDLAMSYAHMHVNRLLRSAQRAQELVLYEFLDRLYASQAARRPPST
ncbi:MAG: lantibiotic dehydratase [Actinomycetota bacterium]|nr:lantibiotic dehydratase [Actinomycetota bacterium]